MPLPPNMDTRDLYAAIVNDFESAWDAIARDPTATGGGNFMFARQAMTLLEWASRLCMEDASGTALRELGDVLRGREPRYFTRLPAPCADCSEFSRFCGPCSTWCATAERTSISRSPPSFRTAPISVYPQRV